MSLRHRPSTLREANAFVAEHHRHHPQARGCRFTLAVEDELYVVRGVAIVGRPVSRIKQAAEPLTAEVTRLCTDGASNACSLLYAACWRSWRTMGGTQMGTYILASESGTSLKAAGWHYRYTTDGGSHDRPSRRRVDSSTTEPKQWWEAS